MKDSRIEWIGEIPKDWNCKKLKYILSTPLMYGANESGEEYNEQYPRYIRITDIDDNNKLKEEGKLSLSSIIAKPYILQDNDILFARSGASVGKTFLYKTIYGKAAFAGYLIKAQIDTSIALPKYIYYSTLSTGYENWKNSMFTQATIQNIGADKYAIYEIPMPPIDEQFRIVRFLDEKCAEIDALSGDIQAEIVTLDEYKCSLIIEKVTKGLSPDVRMKNSEIEWLGEIPDKWRLSRVGNVYKLRNLKVSDKDYMPLSVTQKGVVPQLETAAKTNAHDDRKLVRRGDFVINSRSDRRGSCGISAYEGSVSLINTVLEPLGEMNPQYYDWLFHTIQFGDEFYKWGHGIVDDLWTTNWRDMKKITIPMPNLNEQGKIASFLDAKCAEIDSIIQTKKEQLAVLDEYKKSIIYEYVTGKKEVV